jgi:protein TonB
MAVRRDDRSRAGLPPAVADAAGSAPRSEGHGRDAGDTLPPTPLAALIAAGGAELLVLSADAQLIDTVQRASNGQLRISAVATWKALEAAMAATQRAVVLIDAELLGGGAARRLSALDAYSHKAVTLVAASRSVAEGLMGLLSERKIHRLLIKPPALGITRLLIDSAVNRCLRLPTLPPQPPEAPAPEQLRASVTRRRHAPLPFWVFAAAGAALLAGVGMIVGVSAWWRSSAGSDSGVPSSYTVIETDGAAAGGGVEQIDIEALFAEAEAALLINAHATAAAALARVRAADPQSGRLTFLEAQLERAQLAASEPAPLPSEAQPRPAENAELGSLLTIARARIERGQLLQPAGDGAREYVDRAERLAPENADVAAVRSELGAALVAAARSALAAGSIDRASALAREAQGRGGDSRALAQLDAELARAQTARTAQRHAERVELAVRRVGEGAILTPADDSAHFHLRRLQAEAPKQSGLDAAWEAFKTALTAQIGAALAARDWRAAEAGLVALVDAPQGAAAAAPLRAQLEVGKREEQWLAIAVPAGELELLERVAPIYPAEAARRGIEGSVDVEFVVDVTGRTRELTVVAAEPAGAFEAAALAALAQYRYRPFTEDGRTFARRARLKIRFALE